jgi:phosphate transport system substrate-binding protein
LKRLIIGIACVLILAAVGLAWFVSSQYVRWAILEEGTGDALANPNINVIIKRADDWSKIVTPNIMSLPSMDMIDGSTATVPITAEILRQFFALNDSAIVKLAYIKHSTTHQAYLNLIGKLPIQGRSTSMPVDLIFVTPPSNDELKLAKDAGVTLDITPIAKDGFVFLVNTANPIDSLTVEQIQDIYTGKITNWKELGGPDLAIKAYQREQNSGSQTAMQNLVMKGNKLMESIDVKIYQGMGGLIEAVAEYDNGPASIGYSYYYYVNNLYRNPSIKVLKINGISPDDPNLIDESYPFTTSYYAVIRSDEIKTSMARRMRDFLITENGQRLIEMAGYCRSVSADE